MVPSNVCNNGALSLRETCEFRMLDQIIRVFVMSFMSNVISNIVQKSSCG